MAKSRRTKEKAVTTGTHTTLTVVENHDASAEAVAVRAYQLYLERGRTDGHDVDDWIEAERQIRTEWGTS
jgi:hypothetical protein